MPTPAELLACKEREHRIRLELARAETSSSRRIELQIDLVRCVEGAGEDPLGEFTALCVLVAASETLGPGKACQLALENIDPLDKGQYDDECMRYCRMVLDSTWADREARASVLLRTIRIHERQGLLGPVRYLSQELMSEYQGTAACREYGLRAAYWLVAYNKPEEAAALLERLARQPGVSPDYVVDCIMRRTSIYRRLGRIDDLRACAADLRRLAETTPELSPRTLRRCRGEVDLLDRVIAKMLEEKTKLNAEGKK